MEQPFYVDRLASHGIECVVPTTSQRIEVHRIIFEELCKGEISDNSRQTLQTICVDLFARGHKGSAHGGARGIVLGCTELPMILKQNDVALPLFDTTTLHALAAVDFALSH